jgi:hypothetical protein
VEKVMGEDLEKAGYHPADVNGDHKVDEEEKRMYLEFRRKELRRSRRNARCTA